jgi:glycosyltransferase involved in cell wall biosynthesis
MRIALLRNEIFLGGVTTHIICLTEEFIKKGHKVYIFTTGLTLPHNHKNKKKIEKLTNMGAEIVKIGKPKKSRYKYVFKFKLLIWLIIWLMKVVVLLKLKRIQIVHIHSDSMSHFVYFLKFIKINIKLVKTLHTHRKSYSPHNKTDHEIAISRELYSEVQEACKYSDDEISLIFNGVNKRFAVLASEQEKKDFKNSANLPENKIIIGIVGYTRLLKGHDILLKAVNEFDRNIKDHIHLVILGQSRNEADEKWVAELLQEYNCLEDYISKFEYDDPKAFYDVFDILVSPSRREGFPLVPIEAMLWGCCVVRSNVGVARDQIINRETGFLFPNEDASALKDILKELIQNEKLRKNAAEKGRDYALAHFTSDLMAEKTLAVYRQVIDQS